MQITVSQNKKDANSGVLLIQLILLLLHPEHSSVKLSVLLGM
jgi:hypothetical protein